MFEHFIDTRQKIAKLGQLNRFQQIQLNSDDPKRKV